MSLSEAFHRSVYYADDVALLAELCSDVVESFDASKFGLENEIN